MMFLWAARCQPFIQRACRNRWRKNFRNKYALPAKIVGASAGEKVRWRYTQRYGGACMERMTPVDACVGKAPAHKTGMGKQQGTQ